VRGKRCECVQIFYRIIDERVYNLCKTLCAQIASESNLAIN
jgi:hypothetical protein